MQDIIFIRQPTVANVKAVYEFDVTGKQFLIKNLTEDDIHVGFSESNEAADMIAIPGGCAQVLTGFNVSGSENVVILPAATSEKGVEVQCLRW